MSDALKRRCLHLYIDYPNTELESQIVCLKIPGIRQRLVEQIIASIRAIRSIDLKKKPAISETLDWAQALMALQVEDLSREVILNTLNVIVKHRSDADMVKTHIAQIAPSK